VRQAPSINAGMPPVWKMSLMAVLVLCFAVQTVLVYTDRPSAVRLEGEALRGASLYQQHNCQSCHQIYGFGGFLGPDLTNVAKMYGPRGLRSRLDYALGSGPGQMPIIDVPPEDIDALTAWLVAMDETGTGQARIERPDNLRIAQKLDWSRVPWWEYP